MSIKKRQFNSSEQVQLISKGFRKLSCSKMREKEGSTTTTTESRHVKGEAMVEIMLRYHSTRFYEKNCYQIDGQSIRPTTLFSVEDRYDLGIDA